MKKLAIIFLLFLSAGAYAQHNVVLTYDAAGNRIIRKVVNVGGSGQSGRTDQSENGVTEELTPDLQLTVYPNPVKETLNIKTTGEFTSYELVIMDLTGKILITTSVKKSEKRINLSQLPKGIYLLRATIEDQFTEWKIVKQ